MAYLDEISVAVSPYIARSHKAIQFYENNKNLLSDDENGGLFLCLGEGPNKGSDWPNNVVPLPELNSYEVENPLLFVRFKYMYFVFSDVEGKINVGNLTWSRVASGTTLEDYYLNVRNKNSRWIYVQFEVPQNIVVEGKIKQVGIYSSLKIKNKEQASETYFSFSDIAVLKTTEKRTHDGYLELIQNVEPYEKGSSKLLYSFVLEF